MELSLKYKHLNNLVNLDLMQKFLVKSCFQIPKIKEIIFDYPIMRFSGVSESYGFITEQELKINFFLVFYFYFCQVPFLKIKNIKLKYINSTLPVNTFIYLRLYFLNSQKIFFFLQKLFLEKKEVKNNFNKNIFNQYFLSDQRKNNFKIHFMFQTIYLEDFDAFSQSILLRPGVKTLQIQTKMSISKPISIFINKEFLQNLIFFWING